MIYQSAMDILLFEIVTFYVNVAIGEQMSSPFTLKNASEMMLLPLDNKTFTARSNLHCAAKCAENKNQCYNYLYDSTSKTCTLGYWLLPKAAFNDTQSISTARLYSRGMNCNVQELVTPVGNGRLSSSNEAACLGLIQIGDEDVLVSKSPNVYRSCQDVKNSTRPRQLVQLSSGLVVMCDTVTDGGGWTIFQRRVTGTVGFYRNWTEYKNGFGDYGVGDFYLGNENIYSLTLSSPHEMRVDMTYKGSSYYAFYSNFTFSTETEGYNLSVSGYTGTAGDSLNMRNNNQKFSTYDKDNDRSATRNCALIYLSAWWYNNCHYTHLNGAWGSKAYSRGLNWYHITGDYDSVSSSEMKVRPVDY